MNFVILTSFSVLLSCGAFGQEGIPPTSVEDAPVLDEVVYQKGEDTLIIQRIEQPEVMGRENQTEQTTEAAAVSQEDELAVQTYIISATAYAGQKTKLKIWQPHLAEKEALEGWSNIDWSVFQNLLAVEGVTKRYQLMLFHSSVPSSQDQLEAPPELPDFHGNGARYLVTSSEETEREATLDFMETVHILYDENQRELRENRAIKLDEHVKRQRQIKRDAAKPKTRVLKIWRHTRNEDEQPNR